jgi:hypothetical protein
MNQRDALLNYFKRHKSITAWSAMNELGILRLSQRIIELEAEGHKFTRVRMHAIGRYGHPVHPTKYVYQGKCHV